jgi:hypothetical protein
MTATKTRPKPPLKLQSIEREAEMCRKAFKGIVVGAIVQHCHHEQWLELLTEPAEARIAYILHDKPHNERAARLRRFRPLKPSQHRRLPANIRKAYADRQKAYADWQKAYADWQKADADWQKAYADWQKAYADRQKAYADWQKAYADWQKAYADWQKAYADWQKAYADWQKAYADWQKADADWQKADAFHKDICGCPWTKKTDIFGDSR